MAKFRKPAAIKRKKAGCAACKRKSVPKSIGKKK